MVTWEIASEAMRAGRGSGGGTKGGLQGGASGMRWLPGVVQYRELQAVVGLRGVVQWAHPRGAGHLYKAHTASDMASDMASHGIPWYPTWHPMVFHGICPVHLHTSHGIRHGIPWHPAWYPTWHPMASALCHLHIAQDIRLHHIRSMAKLQRARVISLMRGSMAKLQRARSDSSAVTSTHPWPHVQPALLHLRPLGMPPLYNPLHPTHALAVPRYTILPCPLHHLVVLPTPSCRTPYNILSYSLHPWL